MFAIRTIKNGMVKINGRIYKPEEQFMVYDGRLDGERYAFGLYSTKLDAVCLWGSEVDYRNYNGEAFVNDKIIVDGGYPWQWWKEVKKE